MTAFLKGGGLIFTRMDRNVMTEMSQKNGRLTVLLASKDTFFKDIVLEILHQHDYPVVVVDSCAKALEYLLENDFDFIIFDPDLQPLTGSDAIKIIKKLRPKIPVIAVSDESSYETEVKIAETGVFFRLGKPINEQITKAIVETIEKKKKR